MAAAVNAALAPFRVGTKERYLPDFTLTFLRTRNLPATYAKFIVPLWFSKLDLRDYLFHAYNVRILSVRSYVQQQRVIQGDPESPRPQLRRWHRPRAQKHMTVELERPFVWPDPPEDFSEWNKEEVEMGEKENDARRASMQPNADTLVNKERRKAMREQAQALLDGKEKWRRLGDPRYAPR